jgi:hypothetical protein
LGVKFGCEATQRRLFSPSPNVRQHGLLGFVRLEVSFVFPEAIPEGDVPDTLASVALMPHGVACAFPDCLPPWQ